METDTCTVSTKASCMENGAIPLLTPETWTELMTAVTTAVVDRDAKVLVDGVLEATTEMASCTALTLATNMDQNLVVAMTATMAVSTTKAPIQATTTAPVAAVATTLAMTKVTTLAITKATTLATTLAMTKVTTLAITKVTTLATTLVTTLAVATTTEIEAATTLKALATKIPVPMEVNEDLSFVNTVLSVVTITKFIRSSRFI